VRGTTVVAAQLALEDQLVLEVVRKADYLAEQKGDIHRARELIQTKKKQILESGGKSSNLYGMLLIAEGRVAALGGDVEGGKAKTLEAGEILKKAVPYCEPLYGTWLESLSDIAVRSGDAKLAAESMIGALKRREDLVGRRHSTYYNDLRNLAFLYRDVGDYENAVLVFRKCRLLVPMVDLEDRVEELINIQLHIGQALVRVNKYAKARRLLDETRQLLIAKNKTPGMVSQAWLELLEGKCLITEGKVEEGHQLLIKATRALGSAYHKDHISVGIAFGDIGEAFLEEKNYPFAEEYLLAALAIFERHAVKANPRSAVAMEDLATVCERTNREAQAADYRKQARNIRSMNAERTKIVRQIVEPVLRDKD
jgi:tetratricopeptide (TPR) repeat protein